MSLKRMFQLVAVEEAQGGEAITGASLYAAANANFLVIDPTIEFDPEIFVRANINRASLSPLQPLPGIVTGSCSFQVELSGTGSATVPGWGPLLQACGMEQVVTTAIELVDPFVGGDAFYHGEAITGSTAGVGVVIHDTWNGEPRLLYVSTSAFVDTETITGTSSGTIATASSDPWTYGTTWQPKSVEILTFGYDNGNGTNNIGEVLVGDESGAIVIVQEANLAVSGVAIVRVLDGILIENETLNNATRGAGNYVDVDLATTVAVQRDIPSFSMAVIEDGPAKALRGCRGTFSLAGNIGEAILLSFEFLGLKNTLTDEGTVTGVTYTAQVPPSMLGVTFAVGDSAIVTRATEVSPRFQSLSIDFANTTGIGRDAGEATGVYGAAHVTARQSTGSVTIDVSPEAVYDFIEKVTDGSSTRMRLDIGSVDGNKFRMSAPSAVFSGESGGETEGIANRDLPFNLGSVWPDGTDQDDSEFVLTYIADSTAP